jgi:asparagine synthetase B (glutamine-hydrolysing)
MSGIVGIIGLRHGSTRHLEKDFTVMLHGLIDNSSDLTATVKDTGHLLGVVSNNRVQRVVKYYTDRNRTVDCMIDGDVFIDDALQREISREYGVRSTRMAEALVPFIYSKWGCDLVERIKGWFNILVYDRKKRVVYLVNSRLGMRPLYYREAAGYLIFCSRLQPILRCSLVANRIDQKSFADYVLFNYPLGDQTYVEGVSLLAPATVMTIRGSKIMQQKYWSPRSLFVDKLASRAESIVHAETLLKEAVTKMHADAAAVGVALTGGFDSRTVLSLLDKDHKDVILYSFGGPGSRDIAIPQAISKGSSYEYIPIRLDQDYAQKFFADYARKCITRSDGRSTLARAHYLYALDAISRRVGIVLTGNCGSELIRPMHMTGEVISDNMKILFTMMHDHCLSAIFDRFRMPRYFNKSNVIALKDMLCESLTETAGVHEAGLTLNQRFYLFLVKEVFRKYFGTEISMEDGYVHNRSPYLDSDFVDFIFKTPLCGANYDFYVNNPFVRVNGQLLYARIINNNNRILARIQTNRLYAPHDLLTTPGRIKTGLSFLYRRYFVRNGEDYGLDAGVEEFMHENPRCVEGVECLNSGEILGDLQNGNWKKHKLDFYKAISWAYWYKHNFRQ